MGADKGLEKIDIEYQHVEQPALSAAAETMMQALEDKGPVHRTLGTPGRIARYEEGIVAREAQKILGMVGMRADENLEHAIIEGLYVIPSEGQQYRRKGIGLSLLERAVDRCIARGARRVSMMAVTRQGEALIKALFEKRPDLTAIGEARVLPWSEDVDKLSRRVAGER